MFFFFLTNFLAITAFSQTLATPERPASLQVRKSTSAKDVDHLKIVGGFFCSNFKKISGLQSLGEPCRKKVAALAPAISTICVDGVYKDLEDPSTFEGSLLSISYLDQAVNLTSKGMQVCGSRISHTLLQGTRNSVTVLKDSFLIDLEAALRAEGDSTNVYQLGGTWGRYAKELFSPTGL